MTEINTLQAKYEACKREAQQWKQEAQTANATIAEIYQLCTGKTGEPGNWNGAKPVRDLLNATPAGMEAPAAEPVLVCGHPANFLLKSAETGEPLYCEICDYRQQRDDAVMVEQELRTQLTLAESRLAWMIEWWFCGCDQSTRDAIGQCLCEEELLAFIDKQSREHEGATPPTGEVKPEAEPALSDERINKLWDRAIQAALSAQEKPNAPALSAQPAEPAGVGAVIDRNAVLEEAAKQCEDIYSWRGAYGAGVMHTNSTEACAAAIRSLKDRRPAQAAEPKAQP